MITKQNKLNLKTGDQKMIKAVQVLDVQVTGTHNKPYKKVDCDWRDCGYDYVQGEQSIIDEKIQAMSMDEAIDKFINKVPSGMFNVMLKANNGEMVKLTVEEDINRRQKKETSFVGVIVVRYKIELVATQDIAMYNTDHIEAGKTYMTERASNQLVPVLKHEIEQYYYNANEKCFYGHGYSDVDFSDAKKEDVQYTKEYKYDEGTGAVL